MKSFVITIQTKIHHTFVLLIYVKRCENCYDVQIVFFIPSQSIALFHVFPTESLLCLCNIKVCCIYTGNYRTHTYIQTTKLHEIWYLYVQRSLNDTMKILMNALLLLRFCFCLVREKVCLGYKCIFIRGMYT